MRRWLGLWVLLTLLFDAGCDRAEFDPGPPPDGRFVGFVCMCAVCFERDFCQNFSTGEIRVPDRGEVCPDLDPWMHAQSASRLTGSGAESFYCLPPFPGAQLGAGTVDGSCPGTALTRDMFDDPAALADLGNVDQCVDVPFCAREPGTMEFPSPCADHPDSPMVCPDPKQNDRTSAILTACVPDSPGESAAVIRSRMNGEAARICGNFNGGHDIPTDNPRRVCFATCASSHPDNEYDHFPDPDCRTDLFDPPYVDPVGDLVLRVGSDPRTGEPAQAELHVGTESARVEIEGAVNVSAPGCGPGVSCSATISSVELYVTTPSIELLGHRLEGVSLVNAQPLRDSVTPISPTRSRIVIESGGVLFALGRISDFGTASSDYTLTSALEGEVDWVAHSFEMRTTLSNPSGSSSVDLELHGELPSLPPQADAGPDQTVECVAAGGTPVALSARGSTDPDGDIQRYLWRSDDRGEVGFEPDVTVPVALGNHGFRVEVGDALGQTDVDRTEVAVVDTRGPVVQDVELATDCLWPPDHRLHLFRLGIELTGEARDACDGTTHPLRIVDVRSDQPDDGTGDGSTLPDVVAGEAAFCLRGERAGTSNRPRSYTVVLEAMDDAGNVTRSEVAIRVPHDQRPSDRCLTGGLAPAVDDGDPRCVAALPRASSSSGSSTGGCSIALKGAPLPRWLGLALIAALAIRRRR